MNESILQQVRKEAEDLEITIWELLKTGASPSKEWTWLFTHDELARIVKTIAGNVVEYAQQQGGCRWVKCSERLPECPPGEAIQIYYRYKSGDGKLWKGASNTVHQFADFMKLAPTDEVEWLDESTPQGEGLKEALEKIAAIDQAKGVAGSTWGDSNYDSVSACAGYNQCLENVQSIATKALSTNPSK